MAEGNKVNIFIFDKDRYLSDLLSKSLRFFGHNVSIFSSLSECPLYVKNPCECPAESSCAEAILVSMDLNNMNGIDLVHCLRERGCKIPNSSIAIFGGSVTSEQQETIQQLGCHSFPIPFTTKGIINWLSCNYADSSDV